MLPVGSRRPAGVNAGWRCCVRHPPFAFAPASCPVHRTFGKLARPFGCGKWGTRNALYLHLAYRFSEVLPNCISFEPHRTTKTVGRAAGRGLRFPSEERKRWSHVWPWASPSRRGHLSPVTHPLQATLGTKPAGQSSLFRKPYLAVSWGPGLTLPSAAQPHRVMAICQSSYHSRNDSHLTVKASVPWKS